MPDFNKIKDYFDKSLFNESSYAQAVNEDNGAYRIEIIPANTRGDIGIVGVIQEQMAISMNPEWDTLNLASIVSNFPKLESLFNMAVAPMAAAGTSLTNAGMVTEKFFVKGSYLQIEPEFKVINWDDDGQPLRAALILLNLCTPEKNKFFNKTVGDVWDKVEEKLENISNSGSTLASPVAEFLGGSIKELKKAVKTTVNSLDSNLRTPVENGIKEISTGDFMLTNSPPYVGVKVGNYFFHPEMIIENINIDFSKQMTKSGPLFANFKLTLSSKTMPVLGGEDKHSLGLGIKRGRVRYERISIDTTGT